MFRQATRKWTVVGVGLALLLLVGFSAEGQSRPPQRGAETTVRGTVNRFTTAPKGEVDGLILDNDTVIHWPPHLESRFTAIAKKGDRIEVTGWKKTNPEGVEQVEVKTLTNLRTKASRENDDASPPKGPKGKKGRRDFGVAKTVRGTVRQFTTAPKGEVDGLTLDDGTVIHWPPHLESRFTVIVKKGDRVEAVGRMETKPMGETVLEIQTLTNLRTQASRDNDDVAPPPKGKGKGKGKGKQFGEETTVRGTVKRFTSAPEGEVDGLILDNDSVLHWPPHLESRFANIAKKGERVEATGRMETNPEGVRQLEVRVLTRLGADEKLGAPRALRDGEADAPAAERRLRALEEKVDRLLDEIKRLRREKK